MPDIFTRLHGPSKATTIGIGSMLVASALYNELARPGLSLHEFMISLFIAITTPWFAPAREGGAHRRLRVPRAGRRRRSAAEQVVEREAGEQREPSRLLFRKARKQAAGSRSRIRNCCGPRGPPRPRGRPVPAAKFADPADQREPPRAADCSAAMKARSARPNRSPTSAHPITRSSSRSTIAYIVS